MEEVVSVLSLSLQHTTTNEQHRMIREQLDQFHDSADFPCVLLSILAPGAAVNNQPVSDGVRHTAGLTLKNNIRLFYVHHPEDVKLFIRNNILPTLSDKQTAVQVR